ncbi:hypothetical protein Y032_0565g13 [Ancylostoma ceylanicum]|uniref:Uncharacterized protein n=1 Tax=Ancylostoma ceylanicum TaxID=53326 RepID=A0A016WP41_9BILA|nr:hypothetical protein Y032_0565g13 [Ancylostoma ceylanicum]
MAYSGRHPILQPVNTMGVRAYRKALDALFAEMRSERLHVENLQRRHEQQQSRNIRSPSESNHFHPDEHVVIEHDWSQENENQPPSVEGENISTSSRVLYYAMYVQHFGLSNEEINAMERLMTVIYGTPPPISYAGHVTSLNSDILEEYNRQRYYFCSSCSGSMSQQQVACENRACTIYGLAFWFFDHAMEEEITSFGSLYQWSSAPFESHHRRLQMKVDQSSTNRANLVLQKYLLSKKIENLFNGRCANENPTLLTLKADVDNNHNKRFPVEVRISDSMYLPKNSRLRSEELNTAHKTRISRSCE